MAGRARARVLLVDDEPLLLEGLALQLRRSCDVVTAGSGAEGLAKLRRDGAFAVVVSDIHMPAMHGVGFLARARESAPDTPRIVLTGEADTKMAIEAINEAEVFRYLTKPCPPSLLVEAVRAGIEQHRRIVELREDSLRAVRASICILTNLLSLTSPVAFGRASRLRKTALAIAAELELQDVWALEISALLSQLGAVTLPAATAEKLYFARALSPAEEAQVDALPAATLALLEDIPQLVEVRAIVRSQAECFDGSGPLGQRGVAIPLGARILKLAMDYDVLETRRVDAAGRIAALQRTAALYDPEVLEALLRSLPEAEAQRGPKRIRLSELAAGMILASDLSTTSGQLLLGRGFELTREALLRLGHFAPGAVREPIDVIG